MATAETRRKLQSLKAEAANEIGRVRFVRENNDHYKGDLAARINGEEGGPIGGRMVKKMIRAEEAKLSGM